MLVVEDASGTKRVCIPRFWLQLWVRLDWEKTTDDWGLCQLFTCDSRLSRDRENNFGITYETDVRRSRKKVFCGNCDENLASLEGLGMVI